MKIDELIEALHNAGWRGVGDAQHKNIRDVFRDWRIEKITPDSPQISRESYEAENSYHRKQAGPRHCGKCGYGKCEGVRDRVCPRIPRSEFAGYDP